MISMNLKKNKNKSVGGETKKYFGFGTGKNMCGKTDLFFILGCNLSYERQVFLFPSLFLLSSKSSTFFVKNKKNAQYCSLVVKLLLHLLKEKIDLVFDPPHPRPLPIFKFESISNRITCVEEQHYVRAWSKGQYVKKYELLTIPTKTLALFLLRIWPKWYCK